MRIALLTDGIWPYVVGGMQKHSYYLCKYLIKLEVQIDLYYTKKLISPADIFSKDELKFINFIYIPYPSSVYFPGHYIWELYKYSREISYKLRECNEQYDIIYAQGLSGWYHLSQKNKSSAPVVLNFHGLNMFQKILNLRSRIDQSIFKPFAKRMLAKADYVQSLGEQLTALLISQGVRKTQIIELGIGIEKNWLIPFVSKSSERKRTFVFVGRYDKIKGINELYGALRSLIDKHDFHFHFIGAIPEKVQLNSSKLSYHGQLNDEAKIKAIFDSSDFLVLPSYSEGMPTVILEAMARGCAIIATNVGAIPNQVSNENGILIEPSDKQALHDAMLRGINMNEDELMKMKQFSLQKVEEVFLWEKLIVRMLSFFNKVGQYRTTAEAYT